MDPVLLSRIQFAIAAGFHFLFPPITIGLSLIIVIVESWFYRSGEDRFRRLSTFLIKIFGLLFTMGVATGIVLEFSFGTNWSNYSRTVGDIFGGPLAAEGILAFFLESVFLGVLLFGRDRVSPGFYLASAALVSFGSHLSGLWIIMANSWMQTPAGYEMINGQAVLTSFSKAIFNPSSLNRYVHVIIASWITGSLFTAGLSAWYLIRNRSRELFSPLVRLSMGIFIVMAFLQFASGHMHAIQVANLQPEKMAAFEALWKTTPGAAMSLVGIPVENSEKTYMEIKIPKLLSLRAFFNPDAVVKGRDAFAKDEQPPVLVPYLFYHIMIGLGSLFALTALAAVVLLVRKKLHTARRFLQFLCVIAPLPLLANEAGWIAAEVGRQPWAVYRVLRTSQAASVSVSAAEVMFTMIMFTVIYTFIFLACLSILRRIVRRGPEISEGIK